jgi:transposase-like protein
VWVATSPRSGATQNPARAAKAAGPRRDFAALKRRRMRAAEMFGRGKSQADVARALGVSTATTCEWYRSWRQGGRAALAGAGRRPRLSADQVAPVEKALLAITCFPRSVGQERAAVSACLATRRASAS